MSRGYPFDRFKSVFNETAEDGHPSYLKRFRRSQTLFNLAEASVPQVDYLQTLKNTLNLPAALAEAPTVSPLDRYIDCRKSEIQTEPIRVLDAPGLRDDYYLNLLAWGKRDLLAVALDCSAYIWNAATEAVTEISVAESPAYISSVAFTQEGEKVAVATSTGCLSIYEATDGRECAQFRVSKGRIATVTISGNILATGSRKGEVCGFDLRAPQRAALKFNKHTLEVCGLAFCPDGCQLASGANDNTVAIWDIRASATTPLYVQAHKAAVKALAWCPWRQHFLATGAGTQDRRIQFWDTKTNTLIQEQITDAQVCALLWSQSHSELVCAHGYQRNELIVRHWPSMRSIFAKSAHKSRILQAAMSPDGTIIATAAANEDIKFWSLFPKRPALRIPRGVLNSANSAR